MKNLFRFSKNDRRSFFTQMLYSYILLLGIILVLNVPLLTYIGVRMSKENTTTYNYITAEQQRYFDQCLNDMKSTATSILYSSVPDSIISSNIEADNYSDISPYRSLVSALTLRITQPFNVSFYIPDYSVIVSTSGIYPAEMYYKMNYSETDGFSSWLDAIESGKEFFFYKNRDESVSNIVYHCSSDTTGSRSHRIIVFTEIDAKNLTTTIRSHLIQTNFNFYITDKSGNVLVSTDEKAYATPLDEQCPSGKYLHYIKPSSAAQWDYCLVLKDSLRYSPIKQIKALIFIDIFVCIISAVVYILFSLKRHALPITDLLNEIDVSGNTSAAVAAAKKKLSEIKRKSVRSDHIMRQSFFDSLLHNSIREEDKQRFLNYFPKFTERFFTLVVFKPTEDSLLKLYRGGYEQDDINTIFVNVFEELFSEKCKTAVIPIDDLYVCMLNSKERSDTESAADTIRYASKILNSNFELVFYSCISGTTETITELDSLYRHVLDMLGYAEFIQNTEPITAGSFEPSEYGSLIFSDTKEAIVSSLINGNSGQALMLFDNVIDAMLQGTNPSEFVNALKANVIVITTLVISSVNLDITENIEDLLSFTSTLTKTTSVTALRSAVHQYFAKLSLLISGSNLNKTDVNSLLSDILAYIDENYSNPNLCATMICNKFNLHPVTLSKLFKEPDGVGMLQYINNCRIERAKLLLSDTSLMMNDIITDVGYSNIRTFNRCFKAITGVTPSAYRKQLTKNNKEG